MGLAIGYWNLSDKSVKYPNISRAVYAMLNGYGLDMLFLVDFKINFIKSALLNRKLAKNESKINPLVIQNGYRFQKFHNRVAVITQAGQSGFSLKHARTPPMEYGVVLELLFSGRKYYLLPLHLKSKVNTTNKDQQFDIKQDIERIFNFIENDHSEKLFLFGDFNENPYTGFMIDLDGFHAHPCQTLAGQIRTRKSLGKPILYNPTWSLLGDFIQQTGQIRPPASYFFANDKHHIDHTYWNMYDQLLMTQNAIGDFDFQAFRIVPYCQEHTFWNQVSGELNSLDYSDHLPMIWGIRE